MMGQLRDLLICLFVGLWSVLVYRAGLDAGSKADNQPVKKKYHRPTYNSGDLLDPITPKQQRLEQMLEQQAIEGDEE
jgi:hypothetical protein